MESLIWKWAESISAQCGALNAVGWVFAASVLVLSFKQASRHKADRMADLKEWNETVDDLATSQGEMRSMLLVLLARLK
jgi:hypothetical protein